jgi:hypothetical protein
MQRPHPAYGGLLFPVLLFVLAALSGCSPATAAGLADFTSDGCSLFPDGTMRERATWGDCCLQHDIAYWRGGTGEERKAADGALRDCVLGRTGDRALAEAMYLGVRAGGHPAFPAWYRWAYGWPYGRGYRQLTSEEQNQVKEKLNGYWKRHRAGYCAEEREATASPEKGRPQ